MRHPLADAISDTITVGRGDRKLVLNEETDMEVAALEKHIAGTIGTEVDKAYPGRGWQIKVDAVGRIVVVQCLPLSAERGYVFHMEKRTMKQLCDKAVQVAGTMLELFGASRARRTDGSDILTLPRHILRPTEVDVPDAAAELKGQRGIF